MMKRYALVLSLVLGIGAAVGRWPGIAVGTLAVAAGVSCEAVYAGWAVRPAVRALRSAPSDAASAGAAPAAAVSAGPDLPRLTFRRFLEFYIPLALTPLIMLIGMPLASGGMSRMPMALNSLAVWPVLSGLVFMLRSVGFCSS